MARLTSMLAAASIVMSCAGGLQGEAWLRLRTAHFELHTDVREPEALDLARALEEARASLLTLGWKGAPDPPGRTEVTVFASEELFHEYVEHEQVAGLAGTEMGAERYIITYWDEERPAGLPAKAVHEIAHDLSHWFTPLQPSWYAEGIAKFLEGVEFDRRTHRMILGEVPESMERVLRRVGREAAPVESVFSAPYAIHEDVDDTHQFYFTSWLLVHYLINYHGTPFRHFQRDLSRLVDWRDAWAHNFPNLGSAELDARLEQYLDGGQFARVAAAVRVPPFAPRVRRLSAAQVYGLSSWIARRHGQDELSAEHAALALALDAEELNALRTRYHSVRGDGAAAERLAIARTLVRFHSESADAWLLLASSGAYEAERRAALEQARELGPHHPGVLELLARRALDAGDATAALRHTQVLIRRTSLAPPIVLLHLRALAGSARCERARHFARSASAEYGVDADGVDHTRLWQQEFEASISDLCR